MTIKRQTWTQEEIELLTAFYLKGDRLKNIAKNLNRSPTAINKTLNRFNIRKTKIHSNSNITSSKPIKESKPHHKKEPTEHWVTFHKVLQWLEMNQVHVIKNAKLIGEDRMDQRVYSLDDKRVTPAQVLIFANQLRLTRGKEIFLVEEVTA